MIRPPKGWNRNPSKKLIAAGKCREVGYKIIFSSFFFNHRYKTTIYT